MSLLKEIQDTVNQYAEIIAQVIKVDVEIVDTDLIRIAGTGFYKDRIGEYMADEGFVYRAVLETGESQVIMDPGHNKLCISCPKQLICAEKLGICKPIKLADEILGIIGLICFSDEQREQVLENLDAYLAYIDKIAEFIAGKAYEKQERHRTELMIGLMNQVVDKISSCVVIVNDSDQISYINQNAINQLGLEGEEYLGRKLSIGETGDSILDNDEFKIEIAGQSFDLVGNIFPISLELGEYAKIIIFREMKSFKTRIYELTRTGDNAGLDHILGTSRAIVKLKNQILKIADSSSTVLIQGESGTGKELVARAIHQSSTRANEPFVAINCGAIPDTLLESELFGYVKGAFTGADPRGKIGKFELANKGVLFLDEIGDMPLYLQVKLLRVLEERKIMRIGSNNPIDVDIRIIAATHKNLAEMIQENSFREDLFYRLNVIPLDIPPLRERKSDVESLVYHFAEKYSSLFGKPFARIERQVFERMLDYDWPGNIRELENSVEFMINMMDSDGILGIDLLPKCLSGVSRTGADQGQPAVRSLSDLEKDAIRQALAIYGKTTEGKRRAAEKLGIGLATLYRRLDALNLSD